MILQLGSAAKKFNTQRLNFIKRRVFVYGGKIVDRIDFEELSLQGVDPSLGPRIGQLRRGNTEEEKSLIQVGAVQYHCHSYGHVTHQNHWYRFPYITLHQ